MPRYQKIQYLGSGCFGEVWKVNREPPFSEWQVAAMKIIKNPGASAWNEVELLKKSQHEHVIKYYDSFKRVNSGDLCIIMEYCDKGTLADCIIGVSYFLFTKSKFPLLNHDHSS